MTTDDFRKGIQDRIWERPLVFTHLRIYSDVEMGLERWVWAQFLGDLTGHVRRHVFRRMPPRRNHDN